jgi:hypothetical protein
VIGALVMISLICGMNLIGVGSNVQYIVRGAVLAAAVIFDVTTHKAAKFTSLRRQKSTSPATHPGGRVAGEAVYPLTTGASERAA